MRTITLDLDAEFEQNQNKRKCSLSLLMQGGYLVGLYSMLCAWTLSLRMTRTGLASATSAALAAAASYVMVSMVS